MNALISLGIFKANDGKQAFHDLTHLYNKLNTLGKNWARLKIKLNLLPVMQSKYLLFDLENYLLYIDNSNKEVIDVNLFQEKAIKLTKAEKNK